MYRIHPLRVRMRGMLILLKSVATMPENHFCVCSLLQHVNHLVATTPVVMVSSKPALWNAVMEVLIHVVPTRQSAYKQQKRYIFESRVHVRCENPSATVVEIQLHDTQARSMAWRVMKVDPRCQLQEVATEGLPVEIKSQVMRQIHPEVILGGNRVECVLQFEFMDVDGHARVPEMFEATSMIEVKMSHDDSLYILDIVACLRNLRLQLLTLMIIHLGKDIVDRGAPDFGIILTSSRFEEDQAFRWMFDQSADDYHLSAFWLS